MNIIDKNDIVNLISIDIETVRGKNKLEDNSLHIIELWRKRCEYLRRKHSDNEGLTDEEIYAEKAGLQAEFGKIVAISISYIRYDEDKQPVIKTKVYADRDESKLLADFFKFANAIPTHIPNYKWVAHSGKRFDFPYIYKRGLILGMKIPSALIFAGKKPWEIPVIEINELWGNGSWSEEFTSLEIMSEVLNIDNPKSDIDGSEVSNVYWEQDDLERIAKYCGRDTVANLQICLRFAGETLASEANIIDV